MVCRLSILAGRDSDWWLLLRMLAISGNNMSIDHHYFHIDHIVQLSYDTNIMTPSYPSTRHWPESMSVHRDDHYHRDPDFFVGKDVVITEKLDGGLTQFADGNVYARSSGAPTTAGWFSYVKSVTLPKLYNVNPKYQPIGEDLYGVHSIVYDPLPDTFFLFHVLERADQNIGTANTDGDFFWSWTGVDLFARGHELRTVPLLFEGEFGSTAEITKWFFDEIKKPSLYGPVREGFVMRIADEIPFSEFGMNTCKFVRANHVQTDEHWTRNWKPAKIAK